MEANQYSRTAVMAAFMRAHHHLHDATKVFDDPYAHRLLTAEEMAGLTQLFAGALGTGSEEAAHVRLGRTLRAKSPAGFVLARARYAEETAAAALARGVRQYVLLGAGLDTVAVRRTEWRDLLQVFELDHPASQAFKRARLAAAGLAEPPHAHFGAIDFEHESVGEALARLPFRFDEPAVFAWLGVTMYLAVPAIEAAWRGIRGAAATGSELVFDFIAPATLADASEAAVKTREQTRAVGEPVIGAIEPATLASALEHAGWRLVEQVDRAAIQRRYFAAQEDGYGVVDGHLARATAD